MRWTLLALGLALTLIACDEARYASGDAVSDADAGSDAGPDADNLPDADDVDRPDADELPDTPDPGFTCQSDAESTLPGVTLEFPEQPCIFTLAEAAAGLSLSYRLRIDDAVVGIIPQPLDAGGCERPDDTGLILHETIGGGNQGYCVCDTGLCALQEEVVDLKPGVYEKSMAWDGRNWGGPSDTGNPVGPPFPPGVYTMTVTSRSVTPEGTVAEVVGRWTFQLVP